MTLRLCLRYRLARRRLSSQSVGNGNVKHTEFEGADHRTGGKAVFGTVELVDWMLGFERPKTME